MGGCGHLPDYASDNWPHPRGRRGSTTPFPSSRRGRTIQSPFRYKEGCMRIEVKGRNVVVSDELRERIEKRLEKVARQVSPLAQCDVELSEEKNPSIKESQIAEITLRLK